MSRYKFVVKPNNVHTSGIIVDKDRRVVQPAPGDNLGNSIENEELFELPGGSYTYRFFSYIGEADFTIKIVDAVTGRTVDGPEQHKSPQYGDLFTFTV